MNKAELDWLAFRYVAGELSDDESVDFDRLLETDQAAREAIAASVEWMQAVRFAYADELLTSGSPDAIHGPAVSRALHAHGQYAGPPRMPAARRVAWAIGITTLSASLLMAAWLGRTPEPAPLAANGDDSSLTAELAEQWVSTRSAMAAESAWSDAVAADWVAESSGEDVEHFPLVSPRYEDEAEIAMPSWLVAAVRSQQVDRTPSESTSDDRTPIE